MLKKFVLLVLTVVLILSFCINAFAGEGDITGNIRMSLESIIKSKDVQSTDQFLVTITRPDVEKESTFKKSYVLCGTSDKSDIMVVLAKYNEESGVYEEFENTEGESRWEIGSFGLFTKEVILSKGANKFKLIAYKKSEAGNLQLNTNTQVNYFTIILLEESLKDKILNSILKVTDILDSLNRLINK